MILCELAPWASMVICCCESPTANSVQTHGLNLQDSNFTFCYYVCLQNAHISPLLKRQQHLHSCTETLECLMGSRLTPPFPVWNGPQHSRPGESNRGFTFCCMLAWAPMRMLLACRCWGRRLPRSWWTWQLQAGQTTTYVHLSCACHHRPRWTPETSCPWQGN